MDKRSEIKKTIEQITQDADCYIRNTEPGDSSPAAQVDIEDIEKYKKCVKVEYIYLQAPPSDSAIENSGSSVIEKLETLKDNACMIGKAFGFVWLTPVFMAAAVVVGLGYGAYKGGEAAYNKVKKHYAGKHQTNELENRL